MKQKEKKLIGTISGVKTGENHNHYIYALSVHINVPKVTEAKNRKHTVLKIIPPGNNHLS
ncbi:hypothetical protein HYE37_00860 [Mycoplasmopsis bovis]|nr:hypothetical protein [Mycoplasmopsis bovis]QQH21255.1 hypothetical protein HYE37_00860 [Mycoplasmopsis bovis]